MSLDLRRGVPRVALAAGCLATGVLFHVPINDALGAFLRWFDLLAPKPGLSGLLILAAFPIGFLLAAYAAHWVITGFQPRSGGDGR